jgi:hypothetical protein
VAGETLTTKDRTTTNRWLAWSGPSLLALVLLLSSRLALDQGPALTRNTIRLALVWYFVALLQLMRLRPGEWSAGSARGSAARWCWTWGAVCYVVHVAMAFHFFHGWSHAHAFEHTRQVGGVGEGLYASYLFTALWIADALAWWCWPVAYSRRSAWWDRGLHCFMLFIVFNGTVVFAAGTVRWVSGLAFGLLAVAWALARPG